jgi:hypothetical protein
MVDYVKLAATAERLITKNGRPISIVSKGALVDPAKPWDGTADGVSENVSGVFTNYSRREVDGTKIQENDKRLFVPAQNLTADILTAHKVIDGTITYQVVDVRVVQPGPITIGYELQVRS